MFGFSRVSALGYNRIHLSNTEQGAYTARMVAMFIVCFSPSVLLTAMLSIIFMQGAIGVLDKTDMDYFADIFVAYQRLGKSNDPAGSLWISRLRSSS